jgi:hypothetical protein
VGADPAVRSGRIGRMRIDQSAGFPGAGRGLERERSEAPHRHCGLPRAPTLRLSDWAFWACNILCGSGLLTSRCHFPMIFSGFSFYCP